MSKKIVFCADGTWNHPKSPAIVSDADTNVYKIYKCLAVTATQLTFYDDGVGVEGLLAAHLLGGALGIGLFQKIKDGYTAIAHAYEEGDSVFIFGFSRGAYTARSLAGMIAACGLPSKNFDQQLVETAFQAYRDKTQRAALLSGLTKYSMCNPGITMLGVWDTVGALGIPGVLFGDSSLDAIYGFLDTSLHPDVKNAYHALAIDERRSEFVPTLWTNTPAPGQIMEQIWFTGVHSDVGGGYAETGLSDITLSWMLLKAEANGIETLPSAAAVLNVEPKHALDQAHESWNLLWGFPRRRAIASGSAIANSVEVRLEGSIGYRPPNLALDSTGKLTGYNIVPVIQDPSAHHA